MLKLLAFFLSTAAIVGCVPTETTTNRSLVVLQTPASLAHWTATELEASGYDVAGVDHKAGRIEVVTVNEDQLRSLEEEHAVTSVTASQSYRELADSQDGESYFGPEESNQLLLDFENEFSERAKRFDLNSWLEIKKTQGGRSMYGLQVSSNPGVLEDRPRILIIGNHHARELMTHHAVLDTARDLLEKADGGDPAVLSDLEKFDIWFVPVVNPDGLAYVFSDERMWRKNRASNEGSTSRGVDLNRNYEFKWGECGSNSSQPGSDIFKGKSAHSEPEVQVMDALNQVLRAEYVISYHSSGNEVLYPYVCGEMAEQGVYYGLRDRLASELSYGKRPASSSGEDFEHHYARYGSLSFLLEIGRSFQPDFEIYESTVRPTILKVLPFLLSELKKPSLAVKIVNGETGAPIPGAELAIGGIEFSEGEQRLTDAFGRYRWRLPAGEQATMKVSSSGFEATELSVENGQPLQERKIELLPE